MRLDKFLCEVNQGTRSQVKTLIRKGQVTVNGSVAKQPEMQIKEEEDIVCVQGSPCTYRKHVYYMLNKPQGVVSATHDNHEKTVLDLLAGIPSKGLFPVGRLDKDTEGLLLICDDGELSHNLLSPRKHVDKTYLVEVEKTISSQDIACLEEGVDIGEEKKTLPAKVECLTGHKLLLTIKEGKFHQVKRMLQAVNNQVVFLKRISFGSLTLDETLRPGEFRELTEEEIQLLKENKASTEKKR